MGLRIRRYEGFSKWARCRTIVGTPRCAKRRRTAQIIFLWTESGVFVVHRESEEYSSEKSRRQSVAKSMGCVATTIPAPEA